MVDETEYKQERCVYIIAEKKDVGGPRDSVKRHLLATDSVYGGSIFPFFTTVEEAELFIESRPDKYRAFEVVKLDADS